MVEERDHSGSGFLPSGRCSFPLWNTGTPPRIGPSLSFYGTSGPPWMLCLVISFGWRRHQRVVPADRRPDADKVLIQEQAKNGLMSLEVYTILDIWLQYAFSLVSSFSLRTLALICRFYLFYSLRINMNFVNMWLLCHKMHATWIPTWTSKVAFHKFYTGYSAKSSRENLSNHAFTNNL